MIPTIDFQFSQWEENFLNKISNDGPWSNWELFKLAANIEKKLIINDFYGLQSPQYLPHFKPLPHQVEVAKRVIEQMNGKAILADEVGLGKTIEAGLILKEYLIRGLVKKALILVPASLVTQWVNELNEKFLIPAQRQRKNYSWEHADIIVSSLDTAKRTKHREIIEKQNYDLIIVDEAHKLKNHATKNYEFVANLQKKFCLLLTATPIQNRVEEIFNLVTLLKPGHLGSREYFFNRYKRDKKCYETDENLRTLVNKVMIRNRREETGIEWTKRHVETIEIAQTDDERNLYEAIANINIYNDFSKLHSFSVLTLQREACSSREAVFMTLQKMLKSTEGNSVEMESNLQMLMELVGKIDLNSKAEEVVKLLEKINDKVIIFTEYRATQMYLQWFLQQHNITSVPYRGGFKSSKKDWMRELFKNNAQVLIATEAGGEGINLQFCNNIINYDLPWNPMRLEQRIGRVHRLGQQKDVHIYNFMTKNTIEERIVKLLYEKIELFERVIGQLDDILTRIEIDNFDDYVEDIFTNSNSDGELIIKMDNLTSFINFASSFEGSEENAATGHK